MAFNIPAQTSLALRRPIVPQISWTRPVDWPTITDAPNEVQFLYADTYVNVAISTTFTRPGSENIYIDWGDGTTDTISTTAYTTTNHTYTAGTGTPCSRGYTTFKIRVYGDAGITLNDVFIVRPTSPIIPYNTPSGLLEAVYGDNVNCSSWYFVFVCGYNINGAGGVGSTSFYLLEYVKLPATYTGTAFNQTFQGCVSLAKIVMPISMPNCTTMQSAFQTCSALQSITIPPIPLVTDMQSAFNGCGSLITINLPSSLPSVTNANNLFSGNYALTSIVVPEMPNATSWTTTFQNCVNLLQVVIPSWDASDCTSIFSNCRSLQSIIFPKTKTTPSILTTCTNFVTGCIALVSVTMPEYFNSTTLTFTTNSNLQTITMPVTMSSLNLLSFQNCYNLQSVTLPQSISSTISLLNCFSGCGSLSKVDIPQSYNITSLANTFLNCYSLSTVTLPTGSQNSLTTMQSAFQNCISLQSVTLPSSMTALTALGSAFTDCRALTSSIVFPSSLNAVTGMASTFSNCNNLSSVTMPVSMSLCTSFSSTFATCNNLETLTMPAVVPINTTYQAAFNNCYSLRSVVLPTTQTTTAPAATLTNTFNLCASLNTITNLDKVGNTSTAGTLLAGTGFATNCNVTSSLSFSSRLSKLELQGNGYNSYYSLVNPVRLTNTGTAQWTGTSPQINVSWTNMSTANLNTLFADMAAQGSVTGKTIDITGATGAAGLSAANRLVITSLGWTITG